MIIKTQNMNLEGQWLLAVRGVCSKHLLYQSLTNIQDPYFLVTDQMNNYIVRSYRDVIVVTKIAKGRTSKAQSIVMY